MNILLLEDNLYTAEMMKEEIEGYLSNQEIEATIITCSSIYEANYELNNNKIDFIISDLNMNPDGLSEEYFDETLGAVITGWIWIKHYVLSEEKTTNIIFYSAFSEELLMNDEYIKNYKDTIPLIPKTRNGNNIGELCNTLIEKIKQNQR